MRTFTSEDGTVWVARLHDGLAESGNGGRAGWEIIEFDSKPPGVIQRISYRPSGWLDNATIQELIAALREGEAVRAKWRD